MPWNLPSLIQKLPKKFGYPVLSRERVKLQTSNFVCTFIGSIGTKTYKSPLSISGKVAVGVVRDTRKFSGHVYGSTRGPLCDSSAFCAQIAFMCASQLKSLDKVTPSSLKMNRIIGVNRDRSRQWAENLVHTTWLNYRVMLRRARLFWGIFHQET